MPVRRQGSSSESVDNYLKAILTLGGDDHSRVTMKALSEHLHVAPASVTNMLQKLAAAPAPLVEYERHRGVALSRSGRRRALEIVRHHRLIETFLYEVLGYPLEELHDEAERLEHFISERFEERIAAKLGNPKIDPHGHAIPTLEGEVPHTDSMLLAEVAHDGRFLIESVSDRDPNNLRWIEARGMTPGTWVTVQRVPDGDGYRVRLKEGTSDFELSPDVARDVRVVRIPL